MVSNVCSVFITMCKKCLRWWKPGPKCSRQFGYYMKRTEIKLKLSLQKSLLELTLTLIDLLIIKKCMWCKKIMKIFYFYENKFKENKCV